MNICGAEVSYMSAFDRKLSVKNIIRLRDNKEKLSLLVSGAVFNDGSFIELLFNDIFIRGSAFIFSDLSRCDFSKSRIVGCDFTFANLSHCNFKDSIIDNCIFRHTNIKKADFSGANIIFTDFTGSYR